MSERLVLIIRGLRQAIAARGGRGRVDTALIVLAWSRLGRMTRRFEALVALLRVGGQPSLTSTVRPARPPRPQAPDRPDRLPRGFGWLLRLVPESTASRSQLQHLLDDPETMALLKAEPRAGRILRPLCLMLGVPTGALPPPPARRATPGVATVETPAAETLDPPETPAPARPPPNVELHGSHNPDRHGFHAART